MLRTLFIDSFHHGSFSPFAARAAFPEENWRRWKSPERSAAVGEDEERLLEEEKSLWRRLGDGDGGNLGIAFGGRNEGFRKWGLSEVF